MDGDDEGPPPSDGYEASFIATVTLEERYQYPDFWTGSSAFQNRYGELLPSWAEEAVLLRLNEAADLKMEGTEGTTIYSLGPPPFPRNAAEHMEDLLNPGKSVVYKCFDGVTWKKQNMESANNWPATFEARKEPDTSPWLNTARWLDDDKRLHCNGMEIFIDYTNTINIKMFPLDLPSLSSFADRGSF